MPHPATIFFSSEHPLFSLFDVEFVETQPTLLSMKFVAQQEFVDCGTTKKLHSGYCSLILDSVMGGAVMGSLDKIQPIATVNFSIQHIRRPVLGEILLCSAKVMGLENQIAVVNGTVSCVKTDQILASAVGSFMIGTRAQPLTAINMSNS